MQRIYSHPSTIVVHHVKNVLDNHGIESEMRGEHLADAAGGLAPIDAWVELWLIDESRFQEAKEIVENILDDTDVELADAKEKWTCPGCKEDIEVQFAVCWNCGAKQPE